ncbi:Holliday junction endonuclease RuvC [Mariniphaga anaerophila]|uniref:Crossover junction endodeoxyribonuclease RuvC n=1 Tax=Mariniphaga anaerophila TaxID=1484053 RepID=A0A1M5CLA3_9BACT|nr:crossover junction endodeoxyribonuclease RuvC [Mariniphaga anaerophila]SHF55377.1 Holliday junction endonuclease RuvC [Mariniphaga anaerophila]
MNGKPLKILGIDPGTTVTGYGLVEVRNNKPVIINMGTLVPGKYSDHYQRLQYLHERALHLVDEYRPDVMAIEAPFYGKNVQSMLKLGRGQGVLMAAALHFSVPIHEYAPLLVKQAITGMGRASKEQVKYFLQKVYNLTDLDQALDATDAVAVAICHFIQQGKPQKNKEYKNWGDFIKKNPGRVK